MPVLTGRRAVGNLPIDPTSFVGRRRELGEIKSALSDGRLLTLTGPGGVGKTRLALRVAGNLRRNVRHGAWFIELADLRDSTLLPFGLRGAELGHHDGHCTFEAVLAKYELHDVGLQRMANSIRSADLPYNEPTVPEAPGVLAILTGIRDGSSTDQERLQRGSVICDARYAYCQKTHTAGEFEDDKA